MSGTRGTGGSEAGVPASASAANSIAELSEEDEKNPHNISVTGQIGFREIADIADALKYNFNAKINLDISRTTGLRAIGDYALSSCRALVDVKIPYGVKDIGQGAFSGCSSLTSVNIPNGVTTISDHAFMSCTALTSVNIPYSVKEIGANAFYNTALTRITGNISGWYNSESKPVVLTPETLKKGHNSRFTRNP